MQLRQYKLRIFSILFIVLAFAMVSQQAYAFNFSNLFFFGDSLSDAGNVTNNPNCNNGVCTNPPGNVWAQFLGSKYGKHVTPSNNGGTDHAHIGASTNDTAPGVTNVNTQVANVIAAHHGHLDRNALYTVWAGADNIIDALFNDPTSFPAAAIATASTDVMNEAIALHHAGARFIMIGNIPDIGNTPGGRLANQLFPGVQGTLTASSNSINNQLRNKLNGLHFDVIQLDFAGLFRDILADPAAFGFTDVVSNCDVTNDPTCKGKLFVFQIHPTQAGHEVLADYAFSVLSAPDFASALALIPFANIQSQDNVIKQQLIPYAPHYMKKRLHVFLSGNAAPAYHPARMQNTMPTYHSNNYSSTVGVLYYLNPETEIGAAYGHNFNKSDFGGNAGDVNWNSDILSVFASYFNNIFFANGIINFGHMSFNDIDRHFYLGPKSTWADGNSSGWLYGVHSSVGYFVIHHHDWQTGPFLAAGYSYLMVNGYTEKGADAANIAFGSQHNDSLVAGIGWRARMVNTYHRMHIITNVFVSADRSWIGGARNINFHVASIVGSHAFLPVNVPCQNFFTAGFNVGDQLHNGLIISLGYLASAGDENSIAQNVNVGFTYPLEN